MSQCAIIAQVFPPPGPILQIDGNTGSAVPAAGIINIITSNSTPIFAASGNTVLLDFAATSNLILGSTTTVSGTNNTGIGTSALTSIGSGTANTAIGHLAGTDITTGGGNVIVGSGTLASLLTGNNNTVLGTGSGSSYSSVESYNILLNNTGTALDVGVIRIGTNGVGPNQQSECFIAGIDGVNIGSVSKVVTMASNQLGTATITAGAGITVTPGANTITIAATGAGFIQTITGNTGGPESPSAGNFNILTSSTTVKFNGTAATQTLDFNVNNLLLGSSGAITAGTDNTGLGLIALANTTTGSDNTGIGYEALVTNTTGSNNTAVGSFALYLATTLAGNAANNNTGIGYSSLSAITTGDSNIALGANSGNAWTTESNNIAVGATGSAADSGRIRIGTNATHTSCFITGIDGVNVGSTARVVTEASDQLGTATITAGTGITVTPGANTITIAATGAGLIQTITGNSGGAESPSAGNFNIVTANSSVIFAGTAATETLDFTRTTNLVLGNSISSLAGGTWNTGIGAANAVGNSVFNALTSGTNNVAVGNGALQVLNSGQSNVAVGSTAGFGITTGTNNTALGQATLVGVSTGSYNTCIGSGSGGSFATGTEASNICINSTGINGNSHTLRIGAATGTGTQELNRAFICGIDGVNVGSVAKVVTMASDQLGTATITAGTGITVTPGANTITITASATPFAWSVITANQTAVINNGYFCNKAGTLALALPAASAVGDIIEVTNENTATGVQFTQAAGQQILLPNNTSTTLGAAGTLTSSAIGDTLKIVCKTANTIWRVTSMTGNWTPA